MTRAFVIPPTADLIERIADHLRPEGNDYRACRVVFPGKRPQHFLLKSVARRVGTSFLPPHIHAIDDFAEFIALRHLPAGIRKATQLDAARILFDIHRAMPERLGGTHFLALERFLPLGLRLFMELEELALSMAPPAHVRQETSVITSGKLHLIAEIAERFSVALTERELTTRAQLYVTAAGQFIDSDVEGMRQLVFAGFYGFTPAERMLLTKAAQFKGAAFFFTDGPGLRRRLEEIGMEAEWEEGEPGDPEISLTESADPHGEVFAVAADLRTELAAGRTPTERNVIVVPQADTLFPLLHHALGQLPADGYNISLGIPLERTPLAGLFHALHELAATERNGRLAVSAYLQVMLHPYVKNYRFGQRTDVSRILMHTLEERLAERSGRGTVTLEEIEHDDELFTQAVFRIPDEGSLNAVQLREHLHDIHRRFFRSWRRPASVGSFAAACAEIVQTVHDRTTAPHHPTFRRFAESFADTFRELERSLLADLTFASDDLYLDLLRRVLAAGTVPFPGSPLHGLQVLGVLETRSLRFDTVTILDANDDVLPGRGGAEALLPQAVRKKLGMDTHGDREEIIEYYLTTLMRGARRVRVLYVNGGGKERSRIVERLVWERQRKARSITEGERKDAVRYRVSLVAQRPEPISKTDALIGALRRRRYSATALDAYLRCPLRFYYSSVLGLRERDDVSDDIDAPELGLFVHAILQKFFAPHGGMVLEPATLTRTEVERLAGTLFDERFGGGELAARLLMRDRVVARLGEYMEAYQGPLAESARIEILGLEVAEEAMLADSRFAVRLDRVERRTAADGTSAVHILDYKTGGRPGKVRIRFDRLDTAKRETWPEAIGSLQLALYALVYAEAHGIAPESVRAAYLFLGRQQVTPKIEMGLFDKGDIDPAEGLARVRMVVEGLVKELLDPSVPFRPADDLEKHCPRCPFMAICGTTWTEKRGE